MRGRGPQTAHGCKRVERAGHCSRQYSPCALLHHEASEFLHCGDWVWDEMPLPPWVVESLLAHPAQSSVPSPTQTRLETLMAPVSATR